jgi:hypothetical protein
MALSFTCMFRRFAVKGFRAAFSSREPESTSLENAMA